MPRILFLHGSAGGPNGAKAQSLKQRYGSANVSAPRLAYSGRLLPKSATTLLKEGRAILERAEQQTRQEIENFKPEIIVGTSMGAGLAMKIGGDLPMLLIAPVWNSRIKSTGLVENADLGPMVESAATSAISIGLSLFRPLENFGIPDFVRPNTIILHSRNDQLFDLKNSVKLLANSLPASEGALAEVNTSNEFAQVFSFAESDSDNPFEVSETDKRLVIVGDGHRMNDAATLDAMLTAVDILANLFGNSRLDD